MAQRGCPCRSRYILTMLALETPSKTEARWDAHLRLQFVRDGARTRLNQREHVGPLRVLKTLYPEGEAIAHAVIVHPPAGIASTDTLRVDCVLDAGAHAVIATPGAQKWYRSAAPVQATVRGGEALTRIRVGDDAVLEWLPQEAIVYDGCVGAQDITFDLAPRARAIAWEIAQFGRVDSGETFTHGRFAQTLNLLINGRLRFTEKLVLNGDDAALAHPTDGPRFNVMGNCWIVGLPKCEAALAQVRDACEASAALAGATVLGGDTLLVKAVAHRAESIRDLFIECRKLVRSDLCGASSAPLRIWST